jgi:membrane fusion protein, multidrug efflux system
MRGDLSKKFLMKTGSRKHQALTVTVVLVVIAVSLYYVFSSSTPQQQRRNRFAAEGPVPVLVSSSTYADVPVYLNAVGTVRALNTVTVRPQVDGKLIAVDFKEGQDVRRGDVLARIDPAIFQAAYDQAAAKKAQDQALLANAKNDLERYERLVATNAINKQQADTQRALVAQDTALIEADQAGIENAQAMLNYTTIRAPISGRTGLRQVDEGNIVHASDPTGIAVITQLKPISVLFTLPQQNLNEVNAAFATGPLPTDALRSDTDQTIDHGILSVVDNQVDASTGTVKLKAEFPNSNLLLWPGAFVNVRLLINTLKHVVVIPTGAVQRGSNGTFVYAVNNNNTVSMRSIQVQKQDETQTVVARGLTPPERVVTTGFARLTDDAKISIGDANTPEDVGMRPHKNEPPHNGQAGAGERRRRDGGNQKPHTQQ